MNRHERRRAKATGQGATREDYAAAAEAFFDGLKIIVETQKQSGGEPPRFRLLPKEIGCLASLYDIGDRLCLNETARAIMEIWLAAARSVGLDGPTYMMFRVFADELGFATEVCGLADLGLSLIGGGHGAPS